MSSKSILIISILFTVSKLVHFFLRYSVETVLKRLSVCVRVCVYRDTWSDASVHYDSCWRRPSTKL